MGVAALTQTDLDDFTAGRITQTDLAGRAGVSRQAVARFLKRRGVPQPSTAPAANATPLPTGPEPIDVRAILTSSALGLLKRSHDLLAGGDGLGPSALKALAATITSAADELRRLGELDEVGSSSGSGLTIAIMTSSEVDDLRQQVDASFNEAGFASEDDEAAPMVAEHLPLSQAAHTLIPDLQERLERMADQKGAIAVRTLAVTLGAAPGRSATSAIHAVMARCMLDEASAAKVLEHLE